ncbi:MAG TPA: hypothetical protein VHJ78_01040 [Actinomycetota bacterium]|nr:hypothetical protein [Actinomycetota bacterium]
MLFEERQPAPRAWSLIAVVPGVILILAALSGDRVPLDSVIACAVVTVVLGLWLRNIELQTQVSDEEIHLRFRGLFKSRRVPISSIRRAQARTYRPIAEYGGWGIRYGGSRGWAYNMSGKEGVHLDLDGSKGLLIGSQKAQELVEAIGASPNFRPEAAA